MAEYDVAVIGAGAMGAGICETAAVHGLSVTSIEKNDAQREAARQRILQSLDKAVARGKLEADDRAGIINRIAWERDLDAARSAGFVIEAVPEDETLKAELFARLGGVCDPDVVLASNTSSISITRLGAASGRAEKVVGMHFFNPVPIMQAVEIVAGLNTDAETVQATEALALRMGKVPLPVCDSPGFVANRVLAPMINEAIFALAEGVADAETIDNVMKLGCRHPMGPLELADLIGLDVVLAILETLHAQMGDPKFRPAPLLRRHVAAGRLGRKTGRGFHSHSK
ncbi:MAG: 3-hydroxyacyl-CoA dehydrogenase NAD-binding domain-containing protein [Planctomycetales bacterium]